MWKLIFSDYETDKVTRVKGELLDLKSVLQSYAIPDKTKFTVVGLYADNKKYTVISKSQDFVIAIKNYSTHKDNDKYWTIVIDLKQDLFIEMVVKSNDIRTDLNNYMNYLSDPLLQTLANDSEPVINIDPVNLQYNNGEPFQANISEIDRVWVEQLRGENILK